MVTLIDNGCPVQAIVAAFHLDERTVMDNKNEVDDAESWEPFCDNSESRELLRSIGFPHLKDEEADRFFEGITIPQKEKRLADLLWNGHVRKRAEIEYIAQKD